MGQSPSTLADNPFVPIQFNSAIGCHAATGVRSQLQPEFNHDFDTTAPRCYRSKQQETKPPLRSYRRSGHVADSTEDRAMPRPCLPPRHRHDWEATRTGACIQPRHPVFIWPRAMDSTRERNDSLVWETRLQAWRAPSLYVIDDLVACGRAKGGSGG